MTAKSTAHHRPSVITRRARQPLWLAFLLHRVSGIALALFLPAHFWVLSLAVTNADQMQSFLELTDEPWVKGAETGLVLLLAAHMGGGLRLMAFEWLGWTGAQKTAAATVLAGAFGLAGLFLLRAL